MKLQLPVGIDSFAKIREGGFYYIDKTAFIKELLETQFEANLVTRPRRFGKSLTMSMLEDFFDISRDSKKRFEGLEISKETELCEQWMNRWPVVSLTLKDIEGDDFEDAFGMLQVLISELCQKYIFLEESEKVDPADKIIFKNLHYQKENKENIKSALILLCRMMNAHYGKQVILIVDEYDVPLAKASDKGYYDQMSSVIRSLLGRALKTNPFLKFAVITGCLRISKESIFTGTNNLVTDAITGDRYNEYIGFTPAEVEKMLKDADLFDHIDEIKEWYDGYRFGNVEVYCPWAVLNYVVALQKDPFAEPDKYWGNTSGNDIIRKYINRKLRSVRSNLDYLMNGGILITEIEKDLTYDYLTSTPKNFWSLLYLTGYLTNADPEDLNEKIPNGYVALRIPNKEVREVFKANIIEWFNGYVTKIDRTDICNAIWNGDIQTAQKLLSALLLKTVSYYDYKESFFHAFLAGLFSGDEFDVESNQEYGIGRPDVVVKDDEEQRALVIEVKYAKTDNEISDKFKEAQEQFVNERYLEGIPDDYTTKIGYCAVFHSKKCFLERVPQ